MWQQQQEQGQFIFPNFPSFPNTMNMISFPSNGNFMHTVNHNSLSRQYQWQSIYSSGNVREDNKINLEQNQNQQQYVSYPEGIIHRSTSGSGWQQQETFYPAYSFN